MPTLRNKTTGSGVIIRWKPHPKHSRPSTYQVTSRARSFFKELGYDVPAPGDQVKVPHQVCRPLRLLGDLYFESSTQDELNLGNPPTSRYYNSPSVSEEELHQIRSYVESHPSYIGGLRTGLNKELPSFSESEPTEAEPRPLIKPDTENIRTTSAGRILLPDPFYLGKVDRKSNRGNAILSTASGREVNLGRLPKSIVGKWTVGVEYRGTWTMCLTPQLWSDGYRSDARKYLNELEQLTGLDGLQKILKIDSRRYDRDLTDIELGVFVAFAGHGLGVAYHGEWTIIIDSELVTAGQRVNVKIESVYGEIAIAAPRPLQDESELIEGTRIDLNISKVGKNLLVGVYDGTLVTVQRETSVSPDWISLVITAVHGSYVSGSLSALDDSVRPSEGDLVEVCEGELRNYPMIPVSLPDIPLDESVLVCLAVSRVNTDSVNVSVDLLDDLGVLKRNRIVSSSDQYWTPQGLVVLMNKIPILVTNARYLPGIPIRVRLTEFRDECLVAEFVKYELLEPPESVEAGINLGNEYLRRGDSSKALQTFAAVTELIDLDEDQETWSTVIVQEVLSLTAAPIDGGEFEEALRLLDIRRSDLKEEALSEELRDRVCGELTAYQFIVQALAQLAAIAGTDDGMEQTTRRLAAKEDIVAAVEKLNEISGQPAKRNPHWMIHERLKEATDGLLLPPQSAKKYLLDIP